MPVHETEFHGGCAVVVEGPDENWFYTYCGKRVYGSRGDWLMCRKHWDFFAPEPDCIIEYPKIHPNVVLAIVVMIFAIVFLLVFAVLQGASTEPASLLR